MIIFCTWLELLCYCHSFDFKFVLMLCIQQSCLLAANIVEEHCFCRWRKAWFAARSPTMLALVEQLRSYLGGGCECECVCSMACSQQPPMIMSLRNLITIEKYTYVIKIKYWRVSKNDNKDKQQESIFYAFLYFFNIVVLTSYSKTF